MKVNGCVEWERKKGNESRMGEKGERGGRERRKREEEEGRENDSRQRVRDKGEKEVLGK